MSKKKIRSSYKIKKKGGGEVEDEGSVPKEKRKYKKKNAKTHF